MKKVVSETIDGSIKDIIQLKTLDNSLEFSQMYDSLEDTPRSFQLKLVDALNSLGETMGVPPEEAFNKVLCKSDDENEDVKKKLYNWWRAFFEVLGKCDRIPSDRVQEFDQKIDDLMAEIMKAGDAEATSEEEPVLESEEDEAEPGYEQATKDDEDKMLANMEFAIQHIGEVANKVKAVVNFINPYCGTEVNESGDQPKFKVGDVVKVQGVSGMDFYGRDAPIGPIVKIEPPHPDIGVYEYMIKGRSGEFFAYEDELELVPERFTEEENSMKKKMNERGRIQNGDSEWVPMDNYIGMEFEESDKGEGYWSGKFKVGDKVIWIDPEYPDEPSDGWTVTYVPEDIYDDDIDPGDIIYTIENGDGSEAEALGCELRPSGLLKEDGEQALSSEEFLDADTFIDMMTNGAGATPLFDPYNGTVEKDGTVVLNVIAHKESVSYKDVQDGFAEQAAEYGWKFKSFGYSDDLTAEIVDDGNVEIDVVFAPMQQVSEKLENELKKGDDGWTTIGQPVSEAKVVVDANDVWDVLELLDNDIAHNELNDLINSHVRTEEEIMDAINELSGPEISKKELNTLLSGRMATLVDYLGLDVEQYENMGNFVDSDKPTSVELENSTEQKPDEIKNQDKTFNADGENKQLVAGENKQPVCEMTIEQEVDDPWKLSEMLWSQGKENLQELLRSELVGEEDIMMMLEDMGLRNLTNINDAFAFDFPSILDSLGLDGEAWSQNLEIKPKGGED